MTERRFIAVTPLVLVLAVLGCISVEVVSPEETPLRTVAPFPQPTWTLLRATPTSTPTTVPTPAPTSGVAAEPSISRVFFAEGVTGGREPVHVATEFPGGTAKVYAFATYTGMSDGLRCQSVWYVDGREMASNLVQWGFGETGETWVDVLKGEGGLPLGRYDWELLAEGQLLARGNFVVGVAPQGSPSPQPSSTPAPTRGPTEFDPIIFAQGLNAEGDPIMPSMTFSPGTTEVFAVWACRGMYQGLELRYFWYHNGQEYARGTSYREETAERGRWQARLHLPSGASLPSGDYRLELYVGGQLLQSGTFAIQ